MGDFKNLMVSIKQGKTYEQLSKDLGIPLSTLQRWVEGKSLPPEYVCNLLRHYIETKGKIKK